MQFEELKEKYSAMFGADYKRVAWGCIRNCENDIVVARRIKEDDPQRYGQLVIPGGELEAGESFLQAAVREAEEESGLTEIYACRIPIGYLSGPMLREKKNIIGITDSEGYVWLRYLDSGKMYVGQMFSMIPNEDQLLRKAGTDATEPQWMSISEVKENRRDFTPACQILLDMIHEQEPISMYGTPIYVAGPLYPYLMKDGKNPKYF